MQTDTPVITITTDFGHKGPFVGVMKGVIATRAPGTTVIDMTHEVPVHWPPEAGFWLARSYRYFPAGTVHVAVVDPGVGTERDILIALTDEHVFIAPDNGLLDELLQAAEAPLVYRLDGRYRDALQLPEPSNTFHGRDIFAPVAAAFAATTDRRELIARIAKPTPDWTPGWIDPPETRAEQVRGQVITIDHFGNLISNIEMGMFLRSDSAESTHQPQIQIGSHIIRCGAVAGGRRARGADRGPRHPDGRDLRQHGAGQAGGAREFVWRRRDCAHGRQCRGHARGVAGRAARHFDERRLTRRDQPSSASAWRSIFAHESRNVTTRLNTSALALDSRSGAK